MLEKRVLSDLSYDWTPKGTFGFFRDDGGPCWQPREKWQERLRSVVSLPTSPEWLTLSQAAIYLGLTRSALINRCDGRLIQFRKEGRMGRGGAGQYRFRKEWLDDYIERTTIVVAPEIQPRVRHPRMKVALARKSFINPGESGRSI